MDYHDIEYYHLIKRFNASLKASLKDVIDNYPQTSATRPARSAAQIIAASKPLKRCVAKLKAMIDETEKMIQAIEQHIEELPKPQEREVIRRHYINGESVDKIAMEMYYSEKTIFRYHRSGLEHYHGTDEYYRRRYAGCR